MALPRACKVTLDMSSFLNAARRPWLYAHFLFDEHLDVLISSATNFISYLPHEEHYLLYANNENIVSTLSQIKYSGVYLLNYFISYWLCLVFTSSSYSYLRSNVILFLLYYISIFPVQSAFPNSLSAGSIMAHYASLVSTPPQKIKSKRKQKKRKKERKKICPLCLDSLISNDPVEVGPTYKICLWPNALTFSACDCICLFLAECGLGLPLDQLLLIAVEERYRIIYH